MSLSLLSGVEFRGVRETNASGFLFNNITHFKYSVTFLPFLGSKEVKLNLPDLKLGQAVSLSWADSYATAGWTYDPKKKRQPGRIFSIGYVVQLNDECLTITTSMDQRGASLDDFSIPVGCITRVDLLPEDFHVVREEKQTCTETKQATSRAS